jgi:hypothetical protein
MDKTKAQMIHHKIDSLGEGMARRMMEVYNELANLRFVMTTVVNQNRDSMAEVNEEDVLEELKDYYLVSDEIAINIPTETFVRFNLITRTYELQEATEEGKFTFKFKGIVVDEDLQKDHTFEAANEQHAWQLLREVLINNAKNQQA